MRRDKKKDLILDFTSLLDVVMLLLFFFILFSRFDVSRARTAADDAKAEAAAQIALAEAEAREKTEEAKKSKARYDDLIKENEVLQEQLEHDIRIVDQVTSQEADEIVAFNSGNNLKLILTEADSAKFPMTLKAVLDQKVIGESLVTEEEDSEDDRSEDITPEKLIGWMTAGGINKDSVVMCDFVYSSRSSRSSEAYDKISFILDSLRREYGYDHFYYSSTNTSIRSRKKNTGQEEDNDERRTE